MAVLACPKDEAIKNKLLCISITLHCYFETVAENMIGIDYRFYHFVPGYDPRREEGGTAEGGGPQGRDGIAAEEGEGQV